MKKYLIYIVLLAINPVFTSCENWLDVQPKSQVKADDLFDSEGGFKRALIGVYSLMANDATYGSQGTLAFMEVLAGTYTSVNSTYNNFNLASRYDYKAAKNQDIIKGLWNKNYNSIVNINNILETIDAHKDLFSEGMYEIIKGEALGLRAYIHFDLLRNFAPAPINGLEANSIPYVNAVSTVPFPQLTINQVIDRIVEDLNEAKEYLKDYDPIGPAFDTYEEVVNAYTPADRAVDASNFLLFRKERMNYYAVLGTLARVHLYRGNEDDKTLAYQHANDVINSDRFTLNESTLIASQPSSVNALNHMAQEYMFSLYKRDLDEKVNTRYFYSGSVNWDELSIDEGRRNQYFETNKYGGVADVRLSSLFGVNQDGLSKYLAKYDYESYNVKRIPLLKSSEMYLIIAECVSSMEHLQKLRRKRGLKNIEPGTTIEDEIASEYRKEFLGEGQIFYYFKRKNRLVNNDMTNIGLFTLPIPDEEKEHGEIN